MTRVAEESSHRVVATGASESPELGESGLGVVITYGEYVF